MKFFYGTSEKKNLMLYSFLKKKGEGMDYRDYKSGATEKHFWFQGKKGLIKTLLSQLPRKKNRSILNIGVGTGDDLDVIRSFGSVYALDIDQQTLDMIDPAKVVEKRCASAEKLPYKDNTFDTVVSFDVLEHIEHDQQALDEIFRVLKPGGYFVLSVPAFNALYSAHDRSLGHFRRHNKKTVRNLCEKFREHTIGYWMFFLFLPAVMKRFLTRKEESSKIVKPTTSINWFFCRILLFENFLIKKGFRLPFGLSVYAIYQK